MNFACVCVGLLHVLLPSWYPEAWLKVLEWKARPRHCSPHTYLAGQAYFTVEACSGMSSSRIMNFSFVIPVTLKEWNGIKRV